MRRLSAVLVSPVILATVACEISKSAQPAAPSVTISAPKTVEPSNTKVAVASQPLTLIVENATTSGRLPLTYGFEVATDAGFANKVFSREGISAGDGRTSLKLPDPLAPERTYYWRSRAQDTSVAGPYSGMATFDVFTPTSIQQPILVTPINNIRTDNLRPRFQVTNAPRTGPTGGINYVFELSDTASFANKMAVWTIPEQPNQTAFDAPQDLQYGRQYFWHARAYDGITTSDWSATQAFQTPLLFLNQPTLVPGGLRDA